MPNGRQLGTMGVNYTVLPDGRVWSHFLNKFMSPAYEEGHYKYLQIGGKKAYIHRLVAS